MSLHCSHTATPFASIWPRRAICQLATLALLLLATAAATAQSTLTPAEVRAIDRAVTDEMQQQQAVGVAVGVLRRGEVVYVQAYGHADRDAKRPATTATVFNWASNSKPVMAVAALQLAESGQLDLNKDIRAYVPEFPEQPQGTVTTRQLLCHQSGIPHYSNGKIVAGTPAESVAAELDPITALERFRRSPLIFVPGARQSYSSYAYVLLSAVVQRAGEQPIADQLASRITRPLKLTSFELDLPADGQPQWAASYRKNGSGEVVPSPEEAHFWKHGGGAYKSDIRDFAKWAQALMIRQLFSAETEANMWTVQSTSDGKPTTYGLGVLVDGEGPKLRVSHGGSQDDGVSRLVIYPRQGHGVVALCNCRHVDPARISTAIYQALNAK